MPGCADIPCGIDGFRLAGTRFSFSKPLDAALLAPAFHPFIHHDGPADLVCAVAGLEPDAALDTLPALPDAPWSFSRSGGRFEVMRRDRDGHAVWRLEGSIPLASAVLRWHPTLFARRFVSLERNLGHGLGLVLTTLRLLTHRGLVLHAMAADLDGHGILCAGVSGRGKSTLARLLDAAGATVLTDERPVVRQWPPPAADAAAPARPAFRVYGSPWPSSAGFARDAWAPLRRIYFIEHGGASRITPLDPTAALRRFIPVTTVPWQAPGLLDPALATIGALVAHIPCAVLAFRPEACAVAAIRADLAANREPG